MGMIELVKKDYRPAGLVLRSIKRRKVLLSLLLKYSCLGEKCAGGNFNRPRCIHVRLFDSWPQMLILTQMLTTALLALMQCHVFPRGVSWSLLNLMARQIFDGMPDFQWI